jgi:hypothetical protein
VSCTGRRGAIFSTSTILPISGDSSCRPTPMCDQGTWWQRQKRRLRAEIPCSHITSWNCWQAKRAGVPVYCLSERNDTADHRTGLHIQGLSASKATRSFEDVTCRQRRFVYQFQQLSHRSVLWSHSSLLDQRISHTGPRMLRSDLHPNSIQTLSVAIVCLQ